MARGGSGDPRGGCADGGGGAMLSRSSFTSLVVGVFAVYVAHTCWVMYGIVCTRPCPAPGLAKEEQAGGAAGCIWPYLARRPKLQVRRALGSPPPSRVRGAAPRPLACGLGSLLC